METESQSQPAGVVIAVSQSARKGERKRPAPGALLIADWGVEGDAHAGPGIRQVSLLALESIEKMRALGLAVGPGDFAENVTTRGIDLPRLRIGARLRVGACEIEITQIGKECHSRCAIFEQAGDCVMPREGVFARVISGGELRPGDPIQLVSGNAAEPALAL